MSARMKYEPRPVGPRDVGEERRSAYALRRDGISAVRTWPPTAGLYEKPWMVPSTDGPKVKRWIPIRIWLAPSRDPATGEECDRSAYWNCEIDGRAAGIEYAWPECSGRPITEAAYIELLSERDADDGFQPEIDPWEI